METLWFERLNKTVAREMLFVPLGTGTLKASLIPGKFYYKYFSGIKVLQVINMGAYTERSLQPVKDKTIWGLFSNRFSIKRIKFVD